MTDWTLPPDLQDQYDRVTAHIKKLQAELGVKPRTIEERHQDYLKKQEIEERIKLESKNLITQRRPLPKWKV